MSGSVFFSLIFANHYHLISNAAGGASGKHSTDSIVVFIFLKGNSEKIESISLLSLKVLSSMLLRDKRGSCRNHYSIF